MTRGHQYLVMSLREKAADESLAPEVRKAAANRLKMQNPRKPQAAPINQRHPHYTQQQWKAMRKRRAQARAARRRNRRG